MERVTGIGGGNFCFPRWRLSQPAMAQGLVPALPRTAREPCSPGCWDRGTAGDGSDEPGARWPRGCPAATLPVLALSTAPPVWHGSRHRHSCGATSSPRCGTSTGLGCQGRVHQLCRDGSPATASPARGLPAPAVPHNGPLCQGTGRSDKRGRSAIRPRAANAAPLITGWLRSAPEREPARRLPPVPRSHSWDRPRPARLIRSAD